MRFASRNSSYAEPNRRPFSSTGMPCSQTTVTSSAAIATSGFQWATPMIGFTIRMPVSSRSRSFASCVAPSTFASVEYAFSVPIL